MLQGPARCAISKLANLAGSCHAVKRRRWEKFRNYAKHKSIRHARWLFTIETFHLCTKYSQLLCAKRKRGALDSVYGGLQLHDGALADGL